MNTKPPRIEPNHRSRINSLAHAIGSRHEYVARAELIAQIQAAMLEGASVNDVDALLDHVEARTLAE